MNLWDVNVWENIVNDVNENEIQQRPVNTTMWQVVINFFNNSRYTLNTRAELKEELSSNGFTNENSMDTYRNYLTKAGYLRTVGRGKYETMKEIPIDLSIIDCRNEAYRHPPFIRIFNPKRSKFLYALDKSNKKKEFFSEGDFEI